ncbi:B-cell receptor-associated protein 31 [Sarcoptes scabiei]|uniref:Endoplasmic reticulum transmembrane protein n=2 Tax=Sarcoptes scabiei TaxID=52283 RepID=A0A834RFP0_SARSC|nr:B-cell receptor-associated protein 31 [Sarcoptes scabiei]
MSLLWTLVATYLYLEIALIILMMMSFIRPQTWRSFFQSRFMTILTTQSYIYFFVISIILLLFFAESIREIYKYTTKVNLHDLKYAGSSAFYEDQMRIFRGQRNFYITGFALLCMFIIKRLNRLYGEMSRLEAQAEASMRQAQNAADAASKSISESSSKTQSSSVKEENELKNENKKLLETIKSLEEKLKSAETNLKAMERQSASTKKAFDEVAEKLSKLENSGAKDSRKDK